MINHPNRGRKRPVATAALAAHDHEADYAMLLASVHKIFEYAAGAQLFQTNAADLFDRYLEALPVERDVHTCTACRRFVDAFGGLVTIGPDGKSKPAVWDSSMAPAFYRAAIKAMEDEVGRARVIGPFYSPDVRYGTPKTGAWTHLSVTPERRVVYEHALLSAGQAMAAKREDFRAVAAALGDFTSEVLTEALRLLESESLARSERFVAPVRWLLDLHAARSGARDSRIRDNILWRAIASAPDGYCHPRSSVVGSLLEDIAAGYAFADVKSRFDAKLHPLQYQRPQAAPKSGAIITAEKMVQEMGLAPSLERRMARLEEVEAIWHPVPQKGAAADGVFGHLKPRRAQAPSLSMPAVTMTWEKFVRTVLSQAVAMEAMVPAQGNFIGLTTAVHGDAPPLLRWDSEGYRNPVAWYLYNGGSSARQWGLESGWRQAPLVSLLPTMWGPSPAPHLGEGAVIFLEDALDSRNTEGCIFPETIREELRAVRSVIEAYSKNATRGLPGGPAACGLDLRKGASLNQLLRVTTSTGTTDYRIDRWD